MKRYWILGSAAYFTLLWGMNTELCVNRSDSIAGAVFLTLKGCRSKKGDIVQIKDHAPKYYPKVSFTKRLMGIAGDEIRVKGQDISINDTYIGKTSSKTSFDKPLTPIKPGIIPAGYVFVAGDHERSYDSRYEEFGLVRQENIKGRCLKIC